MKKGVSDILLEQGTLHTQQLAECTKIIQKTGQPLEQCLLDNGFVTAEQLAQGYATFASLEYVPQITDAMADLTALAKIPLKFLRENVVMPVVIDEQLTILTANPL